jgi:hypothetical protein
MLLMKTCLSAMCAVTACVAVATTAPSYASGSAPPRCRTANLRIDQTGENNTLSHRGLNFALRNVGTATCTLRGYPTVRLLNSTAHTMATTEIHFGGPPNGPAIHTVTLHPFHRAFFTMFFAVSGPCPAAVFAWGMRFTPPAASSGLVFFEGKFDLCGPGPAQVQISPLRASPQF